ncbi:MAG: autotransporter outer membrane beta-barrel domain-containing protein, partial [Pseudomonadota bacterium]
VSAVDASGSDGGVEAIASGPGATVDITTTGTVTSSAGIGIRANARDSASTITVDVAGQVTGGGGTAVDMSVAGGVANLILRDGAVLTGDAITIDTDSDDSLILAGTGSNALDATSFGNLAHSSGIVGFDILTKQDSGTWSFTGTQSMGAFTSGTVSGGTVVMDAATLLFNASGTGTLSFGAGTMLEVRGTSTFNANLTFNGAATLQDGAADDRLEVTGDLAGTGSVALDVDYAAKTADTVAVGGNTSGTTTLTLNHLNTGSADGSSIALVSFGGTSNAGDVALASGPFSFGLFTYNLELDSANSQWILAANGLNSDGVSYQGLPGVLMNGASSLDGVIPDIVNGQGGGGTVTRDEGLRFSTKGDAGAQGPWVRAYGNISRGDADAGGQPFSFDNSLSSLQVGTRLFETETSSGTWRFDVFGEAQWMNGTATNTNGSGTTDANALGVGATAIWESGAGHYFGVLAHTARVSSDVTSSASGTLVTDHRSIASTIVVSGGYRFTLNETTTLTPSVGLRYTNLDGGQFTDSVGNTIDLGINERLTARVGALAEFQTDSGATFFASGYLTHELSSETTITAGTLTIDGGSDPTMFEISAGGEIPIGTNSTLFVEGGYGHSFDTGADSRETISLEIGLRASW